MDDESRRALRDLARRAEWRGQAGAAGAALDARTLRELGREIENALAGEQDRSTWGHRASESLAAHCRRAQPEWSAEQIAELNRLREDAMTALAPGPGEAEAEAVAAALADNPRRTRDRDRDRARDSDRARDRARGDDNAGVPRSLAKLVISSIASRRPAAIALAVVGCIILIALVLALPHFLSNNSAQTPSTSSTTALPATQTTASATESASPTLATESATTTTSTSASPSAAAPTTSSASSSRVTAIQISPDVLTGNPPEVIVSGTIDTSGTGDVTVDITITGSSSQPQVTEVDKSGQNSYNLTQIINLSAWCGQKSVRLTVSSGTVSQSAPIAISGC